MQGLGAAIEAPSGRLDVDPTPPKRARRKAAKAKVVPGVELARRIAACGIDEAGRGPVLGPLVVAGVAGDEPAVFEEMGCTDSKLLTPKRREALLRALKADAGVRIEVRVIDAETLDAERRAGKSLNEVELARFRDIAARLDAQTVYVDAADVDARRFGKGVAAGLAKGTRVVSEHKADVTYPIVGAASVVAKVTRDAHIAKLARRLERRLAIPLGSGYCHDPQTKAFLSEWVRQFGDLPEGARATWAPARDLLKPKAVPLDAFA